MGKARANVGGRRAGLARERCRNLAVVGLIRIGRSRLGFKPALSVRRALKFMVAAHLGWDTELTTNGERLLAEATGGRATTFVDVGANVGDWTSMFAAHALAPGCRGLLFDPSQGACGILRERFASDGRLEIIEAAVADAEGEAEFFEEPQAGSTSSLFEGFSNVAARRRTVQVTTIDAEAAARGITVIDVLKVDAEGADFFVLKGASRLLSEQAVGAIQFEYNRAWRTAGATLDAAVRLLESFGYSVFLLRPRGLYTFSVDDLGDLFHYLNFVACTPSWMPTLEPWIVGAVS